MAEYFERQWCFSRQCGLHSLNNFLGRAHFTAGQLARLAEQLRKEFGGSFMDWCGGNYSVEVLTRALETVDLVLAPVDMRREFSPAPACAGYLVNINLHQRMRFSSRHWLVVKWGQACLLLDSLRSQPQALTPEAAVLELNRLRKDNDAYLFLIHSKTPTDSASFTSIMKQ